MAGRFLKYGGILFFGIALLVRLVFALFPALFENLYFSGLFPLIRSVQYFLFGKLPFSGYYLIVLLGLGFVLFRYPAKRKFKEGIKLFLRRTINFLGTVAAVFLFLWGYNYVGPTLAERMELPQPESQEDLAELYLEVMKEALDIRSKIALESDTLSVEDLEPNYSAEEIIELVKVQLADFGYPVGIPVSVNYVKPEGALRRLSISGIYNPFTGEANVESSQGPLTGAFTTAHEVAHAFGITSEAEANFVAFQALNHSANPLFRYSAHYALWRYIARDVNEFYPEESLAYLAAQIPEELLLDRIAIWRKAHEHQAYFPGVSRAMNDNYLKLQGIEAGAEDYNAFVQLYLSARNKGLISE